MGERKCVVWEGEVEGVRDPHARRENRNPAPRLLSREARITAANYSLIPISKAVRIVAQIADHTAQNIDMI
jgi:hypothetical protein